MDRVCFDTICNDLGSHSKRLSRRYYIDFLISYKYPKSFQWITDVRLNICLCGFSQFLFSKWTFWLRELDLVDKQLPLYTNIGNSLIIGHDSYDTLRKLFSISMVTGLPQLHVPCHHVCPSCAVKSNIVHHSPWKLPIKPHVFLSSFMQIWRAPWRFCLLVVCVTTCFWWIIIVANHGYYFSL